MSKVRIAVLCSGGGTNFQAILSAQQAGMIEHGEVVLLISDHKDAYVLTRAMRNGVESAVVSHEAGTAVVTLSHDVADAALQEAVQAKDYTVTGIDA